MKKFDIQRFAKRRIQVGDDLQGKIIYTDTFSKEEVEELANECDAWENYYIVSCTTTRPKSGIHEQMVPNEAENKISSYKIDIAGQTIIQYDGTDITTQNNEISLVDYKNSILIDSIQRYNFNHEIVEDDGGKRYRKFYIEDSHVRPLKVGDEITTNTKFYFNIPDNIYNSLSGVTNPIVLSGSDGFKINCIGNGSDQTLIRFSNTMGSTEEANIYDMVSGTLNTNKSMMQNITTMDSSWVGIVETADSAHPLYDMILVDETTLGNYIEPIELPSNIRRVQIGDNLFQKYIYSDFPWEFDDTIRGGGDLTIIDTIGHENSFYTILLPESGNSIIKTVNKDIEYYLYWRENSQDNSIFGKRRFFIGENDTEANKNNYTVTSLYLDGAGWGQGAYRCLYIEDPNIRPVQVGDKIIEGTQLYFNFPDNPDSWLTGKYGCDVIKCGDKTIMYYATEQPVSRAVSAISFISLESNNMYAFDLNTLEISKNLSSYIIESYYQDAVSYVDDEFQQYILVDITTLGEAPVPTTSIGTLSYKNGGNWNKILSLAQEQVPLKGSIMPGPIKWSAVNSITECTDSKTLYFVFGEEEINPTYETVSMKYIISNSAYNIANISSIGLMFNNDSNSKTILNYNNESSSFLSGVETKYINNALPQIFIDFTGEQLTVYGEIAVRDPETTGLLYNFSLNQQNVISGQPITFESDSSGISFSEAIHSGSVSCTIYINSTSHGHACLSENTKIKILNNDIYIGDLELGDKVIDKDNQETEITKIYNHKIDTVYQIHLDNDETIECSYDHKFLVDGGKAVTAAQLKENDKLGQHTITSINIINKELDVYEIKTESNTYTLANGIICECENI